MVHYLIMEINQISLRLVFLLMCLHHLCKANVVQLTAANFDEITSKYELVFINFYADWCRFSQILAPIFEESSTKILQEFPQPGRVLFGKVDCESETTLGTRFHISKYPTLKLIMNAKVIKREYRGQRSVESITQHVRDLLRDPIESIKTEEEYNSIDKNKPAIIGYFNSPPGTTQEYNIFRKVAIDLRDECKFYWVSSEAAVGHLKNDKQFLITFKHSRSSPSEGDLTYPGVMHSYDELSTWATDKCIPLVREITFENAEELTEEGLPFVILFHHPDDKQSIDLFNKIVLTDLFSESTNVNFLIADGVKFAHPLHHLGKTQKDLPLIAIDSFRHMYLFPEFKDLTVPGKLKQFIQDLHSGKLHREFHFGPDPTDTHDHQESNQNQVGQTSPPESTFAKLAPSRNRYTLLRDEL